jgi:hypothetical protein
MDHSEVNDKHSSLLKINYDIIPDIFHSLMTRTFWRQNIQSTSLEVLHPLYILDLILQSDAQPLYILDPVL